jgi:diacylglycerol kinase family enzyme
LVELIGAFDLPLNLICAAPHELEAATKAALDGSPDLMVILAGDGTARLAARLCGPGGPPLAILPGGTLNILSRALYGLRPWRETLRVLLEQGVERVISGGEVGGRPFYAAAVLGSPALWAPVREAVRGGGFQAAWRRARHALAHAFTGRLHFEADSGPTRGSNGLALICPLVSRALDPDQPALEVALLGHQRLSDAFRLGLHHLLGEWRSDPGVITTACRRGSARARRRIPAILDGELFLLTRSVEIAFVREAYRALVIPTPP